MMANHYPDGLTPEVITALQRAVDDKLHSQGYPAPQWPQPPQLPPTRRRSRRTRARIRLMNGLVNPMRRPSLHHTTGTSREAA
jgi:hypothetical protein